MRVSRRSEDGEGMLAKWGQGRVWLVGEVRRGKCKEREKSMRKEKRGMVGK